MSYAVRERTNAFHYVQLWDIEPELIFELVSSNATILTIIHRILYHQGALLRTHIDEGKNGWWYSHAVLHETGYAGTTNGRMRIWLYKAVRSVSIPLLQIRIHDASLPKQHRHGGHRTSTYLKIPTLEHVRDEAWPTRRDSMITGRSKPPPHQTCVCYDAPTTDRADVICALSRAGLHDSMTSAG